MKWLVIVAVLFCVSIAALVRIRPESDVVIKKMAERQSHTPDPIVVAAGDIACDEKEKPLVCKQDQTANLIEELKPDVVLALGDLQYDKGEYNNFINFYDQSWGRFKEKTRPALGNHEYETKNAQGYFDYFNGRDKATGIAGERGKGYYSFDIGNWHVISLNSNCWAVGGCQAGSLQELWLEDDLSKNNKKCTVAYWHHPFTSSGIYKQNPSVGDIWQTLSQYTVDLVLNGHDHLYERFAPQNAQRIADGNGIRQFTIGTGGRNLYRFEQIQPNSEMRDNEHFGVLKLILHDNSYDWLFIGIDDTVYDKGSGNCV